MSKTSRRQFFGKELLQVKRHPSTRQFCIVDKKGKVIKHPANQFLNSLAIRGLSPATIRAYAYDLLLIHAWLNATKQRIENLTEAQLSKFIAFQQAKGTKPRSINRSLVVARSFYEYLTGREMPRGLRASTPAPHYRGRGRDRSLGLHNIGRLRHSRLRVKVPRTLIEPLKPAQVRIFLRTIRRYRDLAIVYLLLLCGLRSQEALGLEIDDIDANERQIRVRGKGNKERIIPLPAILNRTLLGYLKLERPPACPTTHLFVVLQGPRLGLPMTLDGLRSLFRHRRLNPKISHANPHRFRHTYGADMARAGVQLPVLQRLMGHADTSTTLGYINLSMSDIEEEYRRALKRLRGRYKT